MPLRPRLPDRILAHESTRQRFPRRRGSMCIRRGSLDGAERQGRRLRFPDQLHLRHRCLDHPAHSGIRGLLLRTRAFDLAPLLRCRGRRRRYLGCQGGRQLLHMAVLLVDARGDARAGGEERGVFDRVGAEEYAGTFGGGAG